MTKKIKPKIFSETIFLLLLFVLGFFVYKNIFSSFFFMDDFYFLSISKANDLGEFFNFFKPIRFIPYRPISQQLFFFSMQKIFGLKPQPFHLIIFMVHLINSWLVYRISFKFLKNSLRAKIFSLIYVVAPLHFVGLYSITGSYVIFGVFFFLLSFLLWFGFEEKKDIKEKRYLYLLSLIFFILGIFSSEIVAGLPFLILLVSKVKDKLKLIFPHFVIILMSVLINNFFAGSPETKAFEFRLTTFPSVFRWYILRGLGLPEGVKNGQQLEKNIIYFLFYLLLVLIIWGIFYFYKNKKKSREIKILAKYIFWVIIAAFPFYFMSNHLNPIYFSVSFIGFLFILEKILTKKLFFIYGLVFIILSFFGVRLLLDTHWTVGRSRLSKDWIDKVKKDCFKFNKQGKAVLLIPDNIKKDELEITLQKDKALQLFCYNDKLKTIYQNK